MMQDYQDEDEFHQEQLRKNRQALVFIFMLMVGMVFLGDKQDQQNPNYQRQRRSPYAGAQYGNNMPMPGPMVFPLKLHEGKTPFDAENFDENNTEYYSFRTIMPPNVWATIESQFGDGSVMVHHEFDRPLVVPPVLYDFYKCKRHDNHDDPHCEIVTTDKDGLSFRNGANTSLSTHHMNMLSNIDCANACTKGQQCMQLMNKTTSTLRSAPTCFPNLIGDSGINVNDEYLFYYAITPEAEFQKALEKKAACILKKTALINESSIDEPVSHDYRRTPFGFDEFGGGHLKRTNFADGDGYPLCSVRISLGSVQQDQPVEFTLACQTYTSYRDITSPMLMIPMSEHYLVIGLNGFGNLTVNAYGYHLIKDEFEVALKGRANPSPFETDGCQPPLRGPEARFTTSFTGLRSGWMFIPDFGHNHKVANPQIVIMGDGGQWYSSRVTIDMERGLYNEDPIYMGIVKQRG